MRASPQQLVNLRDLGGIDIGDGRATRKGLLYRADAPLRGDLDPDSVDVWPPATVIDLRGAGEAREEHPLALTSVVKHVPLSSDAAVIVMNVDPTSGVVRRVVSLDKVYRGILDTAQRDLASLIEVAAQSDGPVLIHCTAGKDRTGIAVAILLALVGVPDAAIIADYRATESFMIALFDRLVAAGLNPQILNPEDPSTLAAPREMMEMVLDHVHAHPDGVAGWAMDHGATEQDIALWRERFVETR